MTQVSDGQPSAIGAPLSGADVRAWAGLRADGRALTAAQARAVGHRLAVHPAMGGDPGAGHDVVPEVLANAVRAVSGFGLSMEVVRVRPGCAVLRVADTGADPSLPSCPLAKGLLEALPSRFGYRALLLETSSEKEGAGVCVYTLTWEWNGAAAPFVPANDTLVDLVEGTVPPPATNGHAAPNGAGGDASHVTNGTPATNGIHATNDTPASNGNGNGNNGHGAPAVVVGHAPAAAATSNGHSSGAASNGHAEAVLLTPEAGPADEAKEPSAQGRATSMALEPVERKEVERHRPTLPNLGLRRAAKRPLPWLWRRAWILVLTVVAGAAGGHLAVAHSATTYSAEATLVVQSGAGPQGPGPANDAAALAITYATFIPNDQAVLRSAAKTLGVSESTVSSHLTMTAESGTSVILLKYTGPSAAGAIRGAEVVGRSVAGVTPLGSGVPTGSIALVRIPSSATAGSSLKKYALPVGAILGLLVGLIFVMAAERADPRVDDEQQLSDLADCPSTGVPGPVALPELAQALARQVEGQRPVTLVPVSERSDEAAVALRADIAKAWPPDSPDPEVTVEDPLDPEASEGVDSHGPAVLVVRSGTPRRQVASAIERLRLLGRDPRWGIVAGSSVRLR